MDGEKIKQSVLSYYLALRDARGKLDRGNTPPIEELDYSQRVFQVLMEATSMCFMGDRGIRDLGSVCEYSDEGMNTFRGVLDNALKQYFLALGEHDEPSFRETLGQLEETCKRERTIFTKFFPFVEPGNFNIPEPPKKVVSARKPYKSDAD